MCNAIFHLTAFSVRYSIWIGWGIHTIHTERIPSLFVSSTQHVGKNRTQATRMLSVSHIYDDKCDIYIYISIPLDGSCTLASMRLSIYVYAYMSVSVRRCVCVCVCMRKMCFFGETLSDKNDSGFSESQSLYMLHQLHRVFATRTTIRYMLQPKRSKENEYTAKLF